MGRDVQRRNGRVSFDDLEDDRWGDAMEDSLFRGMGQMGGYTPWGEPIDEDTHDEVRAPRTRMANVYEDLAERYDTTPDFWKFRLLPEVPILVYDMMKYGGCRHSFIRGANYYGTAHTVNQNFRLYSSDKLKAEYPGFQVNSKLTENQASLRGELYGVPPETIIDIDNFYLGEGRFNRIETMVLAEEQEPVTGVGFRKFKNKSIMTAFIYVGKIGCWENSALQAKGRVEHIGDDVSKVLLKRKFYELDPKTHVYGRGDTGRTGRFDPWHDVY